MCGKISRWARAAIPVPGTASLVAAAPVDGLVVVSVLVLAFHIFILHPLFVPKRQTAFLHLALFLICTSFTCSLLEIPWE